MACACWRVNTGPVFAGVCGAPAACGAVWVELGWVESGAGCGAAPRGAGEPGTVGCAAVCDEEFCGTGAEGSACAAATATWALAGFCATAETDNSKHIAATQQRFRGMPQLPTAG